MKKKLKLIFLLIIGMNFMITGCTSYNLAGEEKIYRYDDVKDVIIRFHVLANSDTEEDQNLKLKVRDEVINYLYPYMQEVESIEESRKIIINNQDNIEKIAKKVIEDNGYDYKVRTELARENFPEKSYGNITLPQGNYEAFRVIIGNGEGHNWWCVMFPALCFIDVTKGKVEEEKSEEELDKVIEEKKEEVKVKSKLVEIIENFFK